MKKKDWFSKYPTVEQINKTLEDINSIYRIDFDSLIKERPPKERKGILRTDVPFSLFYNDGYLNGASPEKVVIIKGHNPSLKFISINPKYIAGLTIDAYSLFERIKRVQYNYDKDIFNRVEKKQFEKTVQELKKAAEQAEEEKANGKVSKPKRLNIFFKENGLSLEAIKTRTNALYTYKDINFEDLNKYYTNPEILIKDTSKPNVYYVGLLDQVYNVVKHKEKWKLSSLLKRAYPVKYVNKLLQDAGIKVTLDYDDDKVLSYINKNLTTKPFATFLRLKCPNGHIIKRYTLEELLRIIDRREEISCPLCREKNSKKLQSFKQEKENDKNSQISNQERWFREELISEINNSKYKNKVKINKLDDKEKLDTKYQGQENRNQDIDIFIKFPKVLSYNGKEVNGIGVACNGPIYHSYEVNKGRQKGDFYNNVNINDTIRYNSLKYIILNWNERDSSNEKHAKASAKSFIENRIFPILRSVFEGQRENFDQGTYSKQMQQQRLGEIAQALNDKCKTFKYNKIKIKNLGKYFLLNKKRFAYTDGVYDKDKVRVWSEPLSDKFEVDKNWKERICNMVFHNEDYLKANGISKGTIDYVNKNSRDTNLDLKQYDKVRERRQFARLFEEMLKREK